MMPFYGNEQRYKLYAHIVFHDTLALQKIRIFFAALFMDPDVKNSFCSPIWAVKSIDGFLHQVDDEIKSQCNKTIFFSYNFLKFYDHIGHKNK